MLATHGITHIIIMGNITTSLGRKALRLICRNSFSIKYLRAIVGEL